MCCCHFPILTLKKTNATRDECFVVCRRLFQAVKNGWSGLVINGAVRDSSQLRTMDIGVKALGTCPRKSNKRNTGERDVILEMFGVTIYPNLICVADEDGVVLLPDNNPKAKL